MQLGRQIPLSAFFDLIVGTRSAHTLHYSSPVVFTFCGSTGGIISLGLGAKNWDIETCIRRFKTVCAQSFIPRPLREVPFLKRILTLKEPSRYKTTPLRDNLQKVFGQQRLFGSRSDPNSYHAAKVAVTATDEAGRNAIVLANYTREDNKGRKQKKSQYDFPRPDDPKEELKIWEAAAATSAAPGYFKPFYHSPTKRTYLDGALYHNNPVRLLNRERKLLWPDVGDRHPDILLSIGTGQNGDEMRKGLDLGPSSPRAARRKVHYGRLSRVFVYHVR